MASTWLASWYRRCPPRVLEALAFILREARARGRAYHLTWGVASRTQPTRRQRLRRQRHLRAVCGMCIVEFVVRPVIAALVVVLIVESDDVDDGLRMLLLLLLGDAIGLQGLLPLLG